MKKSVLILFFLTVCLSSIKAQKINQFNSWWYYSGAFQVKESITTHLLYSWSRHDFVRHWQISKLGLSVNYRLTNRFGIGGSYEWVIIFPYGELPVPEQRREHRFLQRFFFKEKIQKIAVGSIVEFEQFFRNSDFLLRTRVKYSIKFPLLFDSNGRQRLGMSFSEQVFILIDDSSAPKLSQNRYYGGFDIGITEDFKLSLGYLNQYIVIRPETIESNHTLMVGIFHHAVLRRNK